MRCEQFYKFKKVRDFNNRKSTLFFLQKGLNYGLINDELRPAIKSQQIIFENL